MLRVTEWRRRLPPQVAARRERALQHADEFLGRSADEASAAATRLGINLRIVRGPMTLDLRPDRLNVTLTPDGVVDRVWVG